MRSDGKGRLLVILVLALAILVILEISLTSIIPPQMVQIVWEGEERIETPLEPFHVRVVPTDTATHLFYTANDPDEDNRSLFHMSRDRDGWSDPERIPLAIPPYSFFDCAYDDRTGEFYIFYCNQTDDGLWMYLTKGKLDELGPVELVTERPYERGYKWIGPITYSTFFADNYTLYLAYCSLSGVTENLNSVILQTHVDGEWNGPVRVGTGNSPSVIQASDGEIYVYSNLWTFTSGPQHVVDEWHYEDGEWQMTELTVSAKDSNVSPFVIEDGRGTRFLLYDHRKHTPRDDNDRVVIHSKRKGEGWSNLDVIWSGGEEWSLDSVCATIEGSVITVYWISKGQLYAMDGNIRY